MPQQLCKLKRAVSRDFQPTYICCCIKKARSGPHMKRLKRLRFVFCFLRRHLSTCQHTVVVDYMDSQFSNNLKLKNQLRLFFFLYFSIVKLFTGCQRSLHCVGVRFCRYLFAQLFLSLQIGCRESFLFVKNVDNLFKPYKICHFCTMYFFAQCRFPY